jgi:hypothetical protein
MMNALIQVVRNASPYLAIELLLPGGSVIALLLWLFRHRFKKGAGPDRALFNRKVYEALAFLRGFKLLRFSGATR